MKLEVRILGDPVLREKAAPVAEISEFTRQLIRDMFETMYAEEGVGLAAPQVGVSERIIVIDPQEDELPAFALINPEIDRAPARLIGNIDRGDAAAGIGRADQAVAQVAQYVGGELTAACVDARRLLGQGLGGGAEQRNDHGALPKCTASFHVSICEGAWE